MSVTRRTLLHNSAAIAAAGFTATAFPRPLIAVLRRYPEVVPPIEDPDVKRLTDISLGAARETGAAYADVRLTHTYTRRRARDIESMAFGVRALVDGYWGFAASPVWTPDEAARLGRAAVRQARANALGQVREVDLAPMSSAQSGRNETKQSPDSGHWVMPVKDDPFEMSQDEINDFFDGIKLFCDTVPIVRDRKVEYAFAKQDKAFASTEGQYCTQRLYRTGADIGLTLEDGRQRIQTALDTLTPAGLGFEYIRDQPIYDQILALIEEGKEDMALPVQPPDVGRYDTVLDASSVANLMNGSLGLATELDRALGYEANADGTSYIIDPLAMLGTMRIGSPIVGISGNRLEPGGVATVQWDDEGVRPTRFPLVERGILSGMQTNREGAGWLRDYYMSRQEPVVSCGCSYAPEALYPQSIRCANLTVEPSAGDNTFDTLIQEMSKGIAFKHATTSMDFQQSTGMLRGSAYEIRNGKRAGRILRSGIIFRTSEIWNAATALGGARSAQRFGIPGAKGEPRQESYHSVTSVPMAFKDLTVIDVTRKA